MIDLSRNHNLLRILAAIDRTRAFMQKREGLGSMRKGEQNLDAFYERVWRDAAASVGAKIEPISHGVFEIRLDDFSTRVIGNTSDLDSLTTHIVVRTKPAVRRLLDKYGLPQTNFVPFAIDDMDPAVAFLEKLGRECVIKPASGTGGGLGITTNVRTRWQIARAAWAAARFGGDLTIEEQVEGDNYRLLFLDGKLIDAVLRLPPSVTGDGKSKVLDLVKAENERRASRGMEVSHTQLTIDMDMTRTLDRQGLKFASVLPAGKTVAVKTAINENAANDNVTVMDKIAKATIEDAALAAKICGVRLAGVDLILKDASVPLRQGGGIILEVNSPPGYYWHYRKREGTLPLGEIVLKQLLADHRNGRGASTPAPSVEVTVNTSSISQSLSEVCT